MKKLNDEVKRETIAQSIAPLKDKLLSIKRELEQLMDETDFSMDDLSQINTYRRKIQVLKFKIKNLREGNPYLGVADFDDIRGGSIETYDDEI